MKRPKMIVSANVEAAVYEKIIAIANARGFEGNVTQTVIQLIIDDYERLGLGKE